MAAYDRFLIAPLETGLQLNVKPWLISNDSYEQLDNAYMSRGRVCKRFGAMLMGSGAPAGLEQLHSRLRINIGTTDLGGNFSLFLDNGAIGQSFSVGSQMFTIVVASGSMLSTSATATGVYNVAPKIVTINNSTPLTDIWWYPSYPVMGITQFGPNSPVNNKPAYAFDTRYAYVFSGGFWQRSGTTTASIWNGSDSDFFWTANWEGIAQTGGTYQKAMFVTNNNFTIPTSGNDDPIRYFDGTAWSNFYPYFLPGHAAGETHGINAAWVSSCRIIVAFKNRLVLLNTVERTGTNPFNPTGGVNIIHSNRARYCHNGSPFAYNAWYEGNTYDFGGIPPAANYQDHIGDGGGYIDASTDEAIISAEFVKDRLIVSFERSTWELAYTNNELQPFIWQKLNTELGCEATFSSVPFDQFILSVGQSGVHACNGSSVERIDAKIPDEVFKIKNRTDGPQRVHGIRDYYTEMVYWTFPKSTQTDDQPYPQRVLVYNYKNQSWAFNDDVITAFGYFEQNEAPTWASTTLPWKEAHMTWDSGVIQSQFRKIICGNQQGFVFQLEPDISRNASVMQITNITYVAAVGTTYTITCIDHSLTEEDYVLIENIQASAGTLAGDLNSKILPVIFVDEDTFEVEIEDVASTGSYKGAGTVTRVSNIQIKSRQWNPYVEKGMNVNLARVDFLVSKTSFGEITVDYSPSSSNIGLSNESTATDTNLGTNILETRPYTGNLIEGSSARLWHPVYFMGEGECIQLNLYFSDTQMRNSNISLAKFELHALILNTQPTSSYLQATF